MTSIILCVLVVRDGSVRKRPEAVHPAGTAGYTDSPNVPSLSTVSSSSDIERIRELEKRIDVCVCCVIEWWPCDGH